MATTTQRHWLSNAEPRYWEPRETWRVRAMNDGRSFQWILKNGKKDASSTGRAMALAEWRSIRDGIVAAEKAAANPNDGFLEFENPADERAHYAFYALRDEWKESGLASAMSFDEYKDYVEFRAGRANQVSLAPAAPLVLAAKPFSELLDLFKTNIDYRRSQTLPGLKSDEDISQPRADAYKAYADHMKAKVGKTSCEPVGDYALSARTFELILKTYREACKTEMVADGWSGHWFNERMKTARAVASYFKGNGILNAEPASLSKLTEKYEIEAKAKPIPFEAVREIYKAADDEMKAWILLALNCGFRQSELALLEWSHVKTIGGVVCIEKNRGKTGVPLAIPLWSSTLRAIEKFGRQTGPLFLTSKGNPLVHGRSDAVYQRYDHLRSKCAEADEYSFENFRDTGATFMDSVNPMLTPLYLGQADRRTARFYVGAINGEATIPQNMTQALAAFEQALNLPPFLVD